MEVFVEIRTEIKKLVTMLNGKLDHLDDKYNVFSTVFISCIN